MPLVLVRLYLALFFLWKMFGGPFLVIARKSDSTPEHSFILAGFIDAIKMTMSRF